MKLLITTLVRKLLWALAYSASGAAVVLIIVFVVYLNGRTDLQVWHLADLDAEYRSDADVETFEDYLALEERLFRQLDKVVYAETPADQRNSINRYDRDSLSDPGRWTTNWNRTFVLPVDSPRAAALLLHGMSDSPYSLLPLGESLHDAGAYVLGLRLPGHGTAPSGLVELDWQDMAGAVELAVRHLAEKNPGVPLYILGYSNGAALAVHYALSTLDDAELPKVDRLVVLSPAIGVTPVAAFAVWQARLGHLLGLDKLAWSDIQPEYDPYKYASFAVNAGDVVYRLTSEIQRQLARQQGNGKFRDFPPTLAFSSVVDATVSTPALVKGLFDRLPKGAHELVLFDVNRSAGMIPILGWDPGTMIRTLEQNREKSYSISLITNENQETRNVVERSMTAGGNEISDAPLDLSWPDDVYSLSHVALPFPPEDTLYGGRPVTRSPGIALGNIALRGEHGVLQISAANMLRLRWNPFYVFIKERTMGFLGLGGPQQERNSTGHPMLTQRRTYVDAHTHRASGFNLPALLGSSSSHPETPPSMQRWRPQS